MNRINRALMTLVIFATPSLQVAFAETDPAQSSTVPPMPQIDTLPPVGKAQEMGRVYQDQAPAPVYPEQLKRSTVPRDRVNTPYSREIVPPGYRYGSPGYMPDGRGGRGYDYGLPGYRVQGGGGYPHQRW
ncbi:MAG: hypothetical protein JSW45_04015 [Thiotrichales bacterium]|nr:MAG: hypothetical protein JSW45_04015 [Thiotrichales bacterium]